MPLEPRGELPTEGHTLLGIRATDAAPVEVLTGRPGREKGGVDCGRKLGVGRWGWVNLYVGSRDMEVETVGGGKRWRERWREKWRGLEEGRDVRKGGEDGRRQEMKGEVETVGRGDRYI